MKCAEYEVTKVIGRAVAVVLVPVVWVALVWVALIGVCLVFVPFCSHVDLVESVFDAAVYFTAGCVCIAFFYQYVMVREAWERATTEE